MDTLATVAIVVTLIASGLYIFERGKSTHNYFSNKDKSGFEGGKLKTRKYKNKKNSTKKNK